MSDTSELPSVRLARGVAGLWAGVSLGGSLIAAPAKFSSVLLTRPVALDVGRAQFRWLGYTELVLFFCLGACLALTPRRRLRWIAVATSAFAAQWLFIMPPLDERTLQIIAGEDLAASPLHGVYIALEVVKFLLLLLVATGVVAISKGVNEVSPPE